MLPVPLLSLRVDGAQIRYAEACEPVLQQQVLQQQVLQALQDWLARPAG
ncbi:MAG: hypothetical protein P4L83_16910 [Nevskia sp.]|nr:hypothetical protein [Nevskia sp.]